MRQESKIEADIFVAGIILFSFIAFIGYFAAFAKAEGTIGNGHFANFMADYTLYIFPVIFIVNTIHLISPASLILLLGLNISLYSFVVVMLCRKFPIRFKSYQPFLATYYLTTLIVVIAVAYMIGLILTSG